MSTATPQTSPDVTTATTSQTTPDVTTATTSQTTPDVTTATTSQTTPDVTTATTSQTTPDVTTATTSQTTHDVTTSRSTDSNSISQTDSETSSPQSTTQSAVKTSAESSTGTTTLAPLTSSPTAISSPTGVLTRAEARLCPCHCSLVNRSVPALGTAEVSEIVSQIKTQLTVETGNLSSTVRKKTSAPDERTSARVAGSLGVALLVLVGVIPLLLDLHRIITAVTTAAKNQTASQTRGEKKNAF
ncbi:hypothetical protein ACOMHN_026385 [Nucella lapillus]